MDPKKFLFLFFHVVHSRCFIAIAALVWIAVRNRQENKYMVVPVILFHVAGIVRTIIYYRRKNMYF